MQIERFYTRAQDLFIYEPNNSYVGLAIEFKSPTGKYKISDNQKMWYDELSKRKWKTYIGHDEQQIIKLIDEYFNN